MRIAGLDLARALAIIGMLAVHIGPTDPETPAEYVYALSHGRASILFLVVAGVGVSLLARSRRRSLGQARLTLVWRAALLLPLGLALQLLDHGAFVILQDYALLFVLAAAVVGLGDRGLLGLAAASATLGPLVWIWGKINAPEAFTRDPVALTAPLGEIAHGLVLSGPYPLITWAAPFVFAIWLGRRDVSARTVRTRLVAWGGAAMVGAWALSTGLVALFGDPPDSVGWDHLLLSAPHSQMPLWIVGATGSACFVLGASIVVANRARRASWPLVATGQLALSVYVGHLLVLHVAAEALRTDDVGRAALHVAAFTVVAALAATIWRALLPRGPLEAVLRGPWPVIAARRTPQGEPDAEPSRP